MAVFDGIRVKELFCKNDDCRKLVGYERIDSGILIFDCPRCHYISAFKIKTSRMKEMFEKLQSLQELKGGEK